MNTAALVLLAVGLAALMTLPRRWTPLPLLLCCCYPSMSQGTEIGPLSWPIYRIALFTGLIRVLIRREWPKNPWNTVDILVAAWAIWLCIAGLFHAWAPGSGPVFAAGFALNTALAYALVRAWCRDDDDAWRLVAIIGVALVPIAAGMIAEHFQGRNLFATLAGVADGLYVRDGRIRSQGPFQHPILAGTVGAVCGPLMVGLWGRSRVLSLLGLAACLGMVIASASSGPLVSCAMGLAALALWPWRRQVWVLWVAAAGTYLVLNVVMSRPAYFLISRIDLTGSSTGWHRARVIQASGEYLSEWWLFGTDRTVHWTGVSLGTSQHADITNYYLWVGVIGGVPAMLLLFAIIWRTFRWAGALARSADASHLSYGAWCLGCGLFAHAGTSLAVAYFDQSTLFFWLNIGVISALYSTVRLPVPATMRPGPRQQRPTGGFHLQARVGPWTRANPAWIAARMRGAAQRPIGRADGPDAPARPFRHRLRRRFSRRNASI